ncbi:flagellar biosynthetic protein FliR [Pedomonas mirosovicensis]|uniref:flagellar biosynthetic protein FliR n=1 Tax=Pedomonas mirosovicensis TaxID=2908641 RepID=UPI0021673519|nr:flagellar biosynthetic protein FliR [Pedomonas mirosovicensis]MCH8685121.1 flagellar type III secretion system protein FliR [Pedomonas mirosovicensis]
MPDFMTAQFTAYFLVFARLGSMLMVMPALGDENVPSRVRLLFALTLSLVVLPVVLVSLPPMPRTLPATTALLIGEIIVGLMLGMAVRILFSAVQLAGTVIGFQSGLSGAMVFDPAQGGQTILVSRFLNMLAVVLVFSTDLHHLMLAGMVRSYALFRPGGDMMGGDFAMLSVQMLSHAFALGMQMAAPFLVYGLVFNVGLGLMARLTPQIQVFFIAQPLGIVLSLLLLLALIGTIMTVFLDRFGEGLRTLMGG